MRVDIVHAFKKEFHAVVIFFIDEILVLPMAYSAIIVKGFYLLVRTLFIAGY